MGLCRLRGVNGRPGAWPASGPLAETSPPSRAPAPTQKGSVGTLVSTWGEELVWLFETECTTPTPFPKSPHSHCGQKRRPAVGLGLGEGEPCAPKRPLLAASPWQALLGSELSSGCRAAGPVAGWTPPTHPALPSPEAWP